MLTVRILKETGKHAKRAELVSLYASDMDYVPYLRDRQIDGDGTVQITVPEGPVILHAKLDIPGYGTGMWITSDNAGAGYHGNEEVDFIHDAALSRIRDVRELTEGGEFRPSVKCLSLLRDAEALLKLGEANGDKAPAYHMAALGAGMWSGELAAVERASARIAKKGKREEMLFGAGGFHYPYDGWEGNKRGSSQIRYPGLPDMKENFDTSLTTQRCRFILPSGSRNTGSLISFIWTIFRTPSPRRASQQKAIPCGGRTLQECRSGQKAFNMKTVP